MATKRISIRIPTNLGQKLRMRSRLRGQSESEVVREALESFLDTSKPEHTAYDVALKMGIIGIAKGLPKDLSTNPRYMEGFGKSK